MDRPTSHPTDPVAAVTHPDPYPYYADLVARRPFERHSDLGMWVAASAEAVTAVLSSDLVRVRPPAEPVPRALLGSAAGEIFSRLVRMNDGPRHGALKPAVAAALGAVDCGRIEVEGRDAAARLAAELAPQDNVSRLDDFAFRLPVYALASLLGVEAGDLAETAGWVDGFVGALAPGAPAAAIARGIEAAGALWTSFAALAARPGGGLLAILAREAGRCPHLAGDAVIANGIGFLSQAYEATAGLLGNTLRALAARPALVPAAVAEPTLLRAVLDEVQRFDPPVQNTRRFVATPGSIAGRELAEGDAILVVLAAANRDPAANPHPERFDPARADRKSFTFGLGLHACPGAAIAVSIAAAGIAELLHAGLDFGELPKEASFRPSVNTRIPILTPPPARPPRR